AVVEAYQRLKPALYMGFYSTRALSAENLRHEIAEHIYAVHHVLVEQIERALTYERWRGRKSPTLSAGSGEEVVLELVRAIPRLRRTLDGDVRAAYAGDPAARSVEEIIFSYPSIEAISAYRIAH